MFIHPIPAFSDNYIWALHDPAGANLCVVDPGDANVVIDYAEQQGLSVSEILITHHHADHTGGLPGLMARFSPRITGPHNPSITGISNPVAEGDSVELFGLQLQVLEVPGHTLDHIAYYEANQGMLFCGDTLFAAGCGRIFEGTAAQMFVSLSKLKSLPQDTRVYCTHEYTLANLAFARAADPENEELALRLENAERTRAQGLPTLPSDLKTELGTNPFLRADCQPLRTQMEHRTGNRLPDDVSVFSALRAWKDNF